MSPDKDLLARVALLEQGLTHERELRENIEKFVAKNLEDQAEEYERRLGELNHAHAQAAEAQAKTVPRELFEQYAKDIDGRLESLATWRAGIEGRTIGLASAIGLVFVIINIAIRFFNV